MANKQQKSPEEEKRKAIRGLETFIDPLEQNDPELYHYLMDTVAAQMRYYSKNSTKNKNRYGWWFGVNLLVSALIPVMAVFSSAPTPVTVVIAILGTASTAINAVLANFHYKDLWVSYRNTREFLLRILRCYFMDAGPFQNYEGDKKAKLVEMCEEAMSNENSDWASVMRKSSDSDERKQGS